MPTDTDLVQRTIEIGRVGECVYKSYTTANVFPVIYQRLAVEYMKSVCVGLCNDQIMRGAGCPAVDCVCFCIFEGIKWKEGQCITPYEALCIVELLSLASYPKTKVELSEIRRIASCRDIECTPQGQIEFGNGVWCSGERQSEICLCLKNTNSTIKMSKEMSQRLRQGLLGLLVMFHEQTTGNCDSQMKDVLEQLEEIYRD